MWIRFAVLWTDPRSEWKPLIPLLRQQLPELVCLGDYAPEHQQAPALWLRCIVDRSLPAAEAAAGKALVIYLSGVSRQELRMANAAPWWEEAKVVANGRVDMSEVVASQVSVRDLKTHLSEWLGRVQAGEVVEVTSHRKPIARITAVNPAESTSSSPLQKAIDAGLISWNGQKPNLPPPVKLRGKGTLLSEILIEDRD